jgi:glutathione S-transferase
MFAALNTIEGSVQQLAEIDLFHAEQPWATERRPVVIDSVRMRLAELAASCYGDGERKASVFRGRWLSCSAVRFSSACELAARSVPFGQY